MGRWTRLGWIALLACCMTFLQAEALGRWNRSRCGCWKAEVDGIFWKPFGAETLVGVFTEEGNPANSHRDLTLRPDYTWGVRIQGTYMFPCSCVYLSAEYAYLDKRASLGFELAEGTSFENQFAMLSAEESGKASAHLQWQGADAFVGNYLLNHCTVWGSLFAGGRYAYLRDRSSIHLERSADREVDLRLPRGFSGAGPIIGADGHYCILPGLQLSAAFTAGVLFGDRYLRVMRRLDGLLQDSKHGSHTVAVPTIGGDLYGAYGLQWGCTCISFKIGYAFRTYFDALTTWSSSSVFLGDELQNITVGGPYGGVSLTF